MVAWPRKGVQRGCYRLLQQRLLAFAIAVDGWVFGWTNGTIKFLRLPLLTVFASSRTYLNVKKPSPEGPKQVLFLLLQDLGTSILDHLDIVQNLLVHVLQAFHAVVSLHPGHLPRLLERFAKNCYHNFVKL